MTSPKEEDRGIDIPRNEVNTPVRTDDCVGSEERKCCIGEICACGTVPVPANATLAEVKAFVYHSDPGTPPPATPHEDAITYELPTPPGNKFCFDHNPGSTEIPNVYCENGDSPNKDNWLVVWARWVNRDEDEEMKAATDFWWSDVVRVWGVCASKTECQESQC